MDSVGEVSVAVLQSLGEGKVEVLRFYRPDDISQEQAYRADYWDVYASTEKLTVSVSDIVDKCSVSLTKLAGKAWQRHTCVGIAIIHHCASFVDFLKSSSWKHPKFVVL